MTEPPLAPFRIKSGFGEPPTPVFPDTPFEHVRAGAFSLRQTAALAGGLARSGRAIDLTGLDGQVGLVCAKALDLEPEEGRRVAGELAALLTAIDQLLDAMGLTPGPP